jgi:hypothetical protein
MIRWLVGILEHLDRAHRCKRRSEVAVDCLESFQPGQAQDQIIAVNKQLSHRVSLVSPAL